jgi:hypothetical protein
MKALIVADYGGPIYEEFSVSLVSPRAGPMSLPVLPDTKCPVRRRTDRRLLNLYRHGSRSPGVFLV